MIALGLGAAACRSAEPDAVNSVHLAQADQRGPQWSDAMFAEGVASVERSSAEGKYAEARELARDLIEQHPPEKFRARLEELMREALHAQGLSARSLSLTAEPCVRNLCFDDPVRVVLSIANPGSVELKVPASDGDFFSAIGLRTADRSMVRLQLHEISYDGLGIEWADVTSVDHELPEDLALRPGDHYDWQRDVQVSARGKALFRVVEIDATLRPLVVEAEGGSAHYYPLRSSKTRLYLWPERRYAQGSRSADVEAALHGERASEVFLALVSCATGERRAAITTALSLATQASERSRRAVLAALHYLTGRELGLSIERWRSWWESEGDRATFWWERDQEG